MSVQNRLVHNRTFTTDGILSRIKLKSREKGTSCFDTIYST